MKERITDVSALGFRELECRGSGLLLLCRCNCIVFPVKEIYGLGESC